MRVFLSGLVASLALPTVATVAGFVDSRALEDAK
jgi:hypothetical protein